MKEFEVILNFNIDNFAYETKGFSLCYLGTLNLFKGILEHSKIKVKFSKKPFKDSKAFGFLGIGLPAIMKSNSQYLYLYSDTLHYLGTLGLSKGQTFYVNITGVE